MIETDSPADRAGVNIADVYDESVAADKLRARLTTGVPLRLACLDIDSTLTGSATLANTVREQLELQGWVVSFITSRSEEMVMSAASYQQTRETFAFARPRPQLGDITGRRVYRPPEECEPAGILDGDVIAGSSGTRLMVRRRSGAYLPDPVYSQRAGQSPEIWREGAEWLVAQLQDRGYDVELAAIEEPQNYAAGRTDIYPPDYRLQVNFPSQVEKQRSLSALATMRRDLMQDGGAYAQVARNLRLTDDSYPGKSGYKLFITPRRLSKAHAAECLIDGLCRSLSLDRNRFTVLFAGDSYPDLKMGLFGGLGTDATLLLAGGSRLVRGLIEPEQVHFAGEPLGALRRRLSSTGDAGVYRFALPLAKHGGRTLIVGDQRFPGTAAVETIQAYLDTVA